jgi:hypothetical protein
MKYMVIERFRDAKAIYERLRERGRQMPAGLSYVDSWISEDLDRCFQLMEADDAGLFTQWMANWNDVMEFEVIPVITSNAAMQAALGSR